MGKHRQLSVRKVSARLEAVPNSNASAPPKSSNIFEDRRCVRDRRQKQQAERIPEGNCRRRNQRRSQYRFHQRDWWLYADYVEFEP